MQPDMLAPDEVLTGSASGTGSDISVLAGVSTDPDTGCLPLQRGARVFRLDRWMARRHAVVGAEVAVTASLLDQLPTSPTVVIVVAPGVATGTVVDELLAAAHGVLAQADEDTGPLTVGIASPGPAHSATAGALARYDQHVDALPAALVEAVAAGRRYGLVSTQGNCVLLLQRFVPVTASAVVHASPARHVPVRVDGRRGLTATGSPADTFVVPADGGAMRETLAWKPNAQVVAPGSTHSASLPESWRHRSLGRATVRQLAALSRNAAVTAGRALTLDVALGGPAPVVMRCRPTPN